MKKITNLLMMLAVVLFAACEDPIETPDPTLEVKPFNIEGTWKLATLNDNQLAEGTYVYLVIDPNTPMRFMTISLPCIPCSLPEAMLWSMIGVWVM